MTDLNPLELRPRDPGVWAKIKLALPYVLVAAGITGFDEAKEIVHNFSEAMLEVPEYVEWMVASDAADRARDAEIIARLDSLLGRGP